MAVREKKVVRYECSDGAMFDDKLDAEIHEGESELKAVCERHGYSPSLDRTALFSTLLDQAEEFRAALDAYLRPLSVKRAQQTQGQ